MLKRACCTVSFFCCGCSLRSGTLVIGWLSLIGAILEAITNGSNGNLGCTLCWGIFAIDMINIVLALGLLYGAYKEISTLLWIWVVVTSFLVIALIILGIVIAALTGIVIIMQTVVVRCALQIYSIVVIRSSALELDEHKKSGITVLA